MISHYFTSRLIDSSSRKSFQIDSLWGLNWCVFGGRTAHGNKRWSDDKSRNFIDINVTVPRGSVTIVDLLQWQVLHMKWQLRLDSWFDARRTVWNKCHLHRLWPYLLWMTGLVLFYSVCDYIQFPAWCTDVIFPLESFVVFDRCSVWINIRFLIKSSQGPSLLPAGKGSQVAKKNLSNIVAAKTIKVQSVLLMLCAIFSVYGTIFISILSLQPLNPWFVCLQAGIIASYGFEVRCGCTVCFSAMIRASM